MEGIRSDSLVMVHLLKLAKKEKNDKYISRPFYLGTPLLPRHACKQLISNTIEIIVQKMKFAINNFFSKCDRISRKLQILSHTLKKLLIEKLIFCGVISLEFDLFC